MFRPVQWQLGALGQRLGREIDGLAACEDRLNDVGGEESQRQLVADIAVADTLRFRDVSQRSGPAGQEIVEPPVGADDGLDQRRVRLSTTPLRGPVSTPRRRIRIGTIWRPALRSRRLISRACLVPAFTAGAERTLEAFCYRLEGAPAGAVVKDAGGTPDASSG